VKASPIEKSRGLYKYIENQPKEDILPFMDALVKSGNDGAVLLFSCFGFRIHETSQPAQQNTASSSRQPLCNHPSSARPHDSATENNPGNSGNYPTGNLPMSYQL
jgi:hypothetical protein